MDDLVGRPLEKLKDRRKNSLIGSPLRNLINSQSIRFTYSAKAPTTNSKRTESVLKPSDIAIKK